jgi:hypothetical protein
MGLYFPLALTDRQTDRRMCLHFEHILTRFWFRAQLNYQRFGVTKLSELIPSSVLFSKVYTFSLCVYVCNDILYICQVQGFRLTQHWFEYFIQ